MGVYDCWSCTFFFLKPLAYCQNVASLNIFYMYYFGRCSSEQPETRSCLTWFQFPFLVVGLLVVLVGCINFLSLFLDAGRMSMSTVSFLLQLDS